MSLYQKFTADSKRRKLYWKTEVEARAIHYFVNTELNTLSIRYLYKLLQFRNKYSLSTKIVRRCIWTNRARWVLRLFKLSRMSIKDAMAKGLLIGVRKLLK